MKTVYLPFEIHLTDPVPLPTLDYVPGSRVVFLTANPPGEVSVQAGGPTGIIRAPLGAAEEFGNSDNNGVPLPLIPGGGIPIPYGTNYIYSLWFSQGNPDWSANFPTNAATFVRKSGGWFGIPLLFGNATRYYWRGIFVYDAPKDTAAEATHAERGAIKTRRWIDPMSGHMGATPASPVTAQSYDLSRDAGRTPDALGFAMRGVNTIRVHTITEHTTGGASTSRMSWERLYVRVRKYGAGGQFWRCRGSVSNAAGALLRMTPTGQISVINVDNIGGETIIGTSPVLEIDAWKKLDITVRYHDGGGVQRGTIWLHLNGVQVLTAVMPAGVGLDQTQFHASSEIGLPGAGYTMEFDIAFWMNANPDAGVLSPGNPDFSSLDFRNGSRAVMLRPSGFAAGNGTWAGDWRSLSQFPTRDNDPQPPEAMFTTTALDELRVTTDSANSLDAIPGALGCIAMLVAMHGWRGTLNGQFGYKIGAAARVLATPGTGGIPNEGAIGGRQWCSMMFNQAPSKDPVVPFGAVELHRIKGNDAVQAGCDHLSAVCEVIGTFGDEDYPVDSDPLLNMPLPFLGLHNAPYPRTPWARSSTPPISPVVIKGGTYVGNGVGQDLHFRSPVHWLWIRRVDVGQTMGRWWSSMTGASIGGTRSPQPWGLPDLLIDPAFLTGAVAEDSQEQQTIVRIAGADPDFNQNTRVYQYVAIMDPGQRFMLNGAAVYNDVDANINRPLIDTRFDPKFLFFMDTRPGAFAPKETGVRGPGHLAAEVTMLDDVSTARGTSMTMGAGFINPGNLLTGGTDVHLAFSAFRADDGSGDPGVARVVKIGSYIGNGLGSRDVVLSPSSGKFPLWALVAGHSIAAPSRMKDASHTGGNSTGMDGSVVANGIMAGGIDFIRVGAGLNTNLFIYNYFVIVGGDVGGPDGFSANGEFIPVEPAIAPGSQWGAQPEEPVTVVVPGPTGPGGGADDIDTDIAAACLPASTRVCNIALSRIGISKVIGSLGSDLSEEAAQMRLHYSIELEATLRAYPWAFATKYDSALVLVVGTATVPVNDDWQYAYRPPIDCVFVRRIVNEKAGIQRTFDPQPPMFRIGQNAAGTEDLIFTNELDPTIEYTSRPACTAGRGDALFRSALAWRLAAAVAPALTRIKGKEEGCLVMFERTVSEARMVNAREQQPDPLPTDAEWHRGRN